jgi:hypothetical protein
LSSRRGGILVVVALASLAPAGLAAPEPGELRAFERAKRPTDALRGSFARAFEIVDSRRVAVFIDRRGRRSSLYVAKTRTQLCAVETRADAVGAATGSGGGCSPTADFFGAGHVAATSGRLFSGVIANDVARVVLVGSRGVRHRVRLSTDGGFIHTCRAYNGCAGLIACVETYARDGRFLSGQPWLPGGCGRR